MKSLNNYYVSAKFDNKVMKQILFCLFITLLLISCSDNNTDNILCEIHTESPCEVHYTDDFEIHITNDGTEIVKFIGASSEETVIPSEYEGYPITKICDDAFAENTRVKRIIIPESVIEIGQGAFRGCQYLSSVIFKSGADEVFLGAETFMNCESLSEVVFGRPVKVIPQRCFAGCTGLCELTLPSSVRTVERYAFSECAFTKFSIPPKITEISWGMFANCASLYSIDIPEGVTAIDEHAFLGCVSLASVKIPESVKTIVLSAFALCAELENIEINERNTYYYMTDGMLIEKETESLVVYAAGRDDKCVSIPEEVKIIRMSAFSNTSLENIYISESVKTIESCAFEGNHSLQKITIMNDSADIAASAFKGSSDITVFCRRGSSAESVANENGLAVEYIS